MCRVRSKITQHWQQRQSGNEQINFERQGMIQYNHVLVIWKSYYRIKNWSAVAT